MRKIILVIVLLGMALATACGSGLNEKEARQVATQAALGTPPPPKYQTAAAIYLNLTMTPTPPQGPPTMSVMEFSYTQVAYQQAQNLTQAVNEQNSAMTQQAFALDLERERIAAAQRVLDAKEAAEKAERTAVAISAQQTANAQATQSQGAVYAKATEAQGTAYWQATATRQNEVWIQATQAAHDHATATAGRETQMVQPTHALWTQTAVVLDQRIKEGQARDVELAVRRQEMKNGLDAYGPWAVVILLAFVSTRGFQDWVKKRIFKRDEHGKSPIIALEKDDGTTAIVKTDLMVNPIMRVDKLGNVDQPNIVENDRQDDVTRRAQAIEALSMLPTPYAQQSGKIMNTEFGRNGSRPSVLVREDQGLRPVFDETDAEILQEN